MNEPMHLTLADVIDRLAAEPDQARVVPVGFHNPHSYRGFYDELAFEVTENITVADMLAAARSADGTTYQGWKGGDFTMELYTHCHLVSEAGCCGESLGAVLLDSLLARGPVDTSPCESWDDCRKRGVDPGAGNCGCPTTSTEGGE